MTKYARETSVPADRSRLEIEKILKRSETGRQRKGNIAEKHREQGVRAKWRALALCIKAKLEAVESGISHFEDEVLANFVMPNGRTFGECVVPQIEKIYKNGSVPNQLLLGAPSETKVVEVSHD